MISQTAGYFYRLMLLVLIASMASACSTQQTMPASMHKEGGRIVTATTNGGDRRVGERAAATALEQLGVPYRYGGSAPGGFDCSGLVHYSYARAGKSVPRTTTALWDDAKPVGRHDMRVGDILFFRIAGKMSHVGLYVGNDRFVHAPSTGKVVSIGSLRSDYYKKALIRAGRPR
ncbi:MAG: C40 family peptidase [Proteobacteria bacterium]|nr:C40 family peptidase [Pseudomonadota bacterium]